MSVSLSKGQRVDLTKGRPSLKTFLLDLDGILIIMMEKQILISMPLCL